MNADELTAYLFQNVIDAQNAYREPLKALPRRHDTTPAEAFIAYLLDDRKMAEMTECEWLEMQRREKGVQKARRTRIKKAEKQEQQYENQRQHAEKLRRASMLMINPPADWFYTTSNATP